MVLLRESGLDSCVYITIMFCAALQRWRCAINKNGAGRERQVGGYEGGTW